MQYYRQRYKYIGLIGMSSGGFQTGLVLNTEYADFISLLSPAQNLAALHGVEGFPFSQAAGTAKGFTEMT